MQTRTLVSFFSLMFMLLAGMSQSLALPDEEPAPQKLLVDNTNKLISALVQKREAIKQDREIANKLVNDYVLPFIDFGRTSQLVLGKYWRSANADQRSRFTQAFSTFLVNNYTNAMVEFTDDIVNYSKSLKYMPVRSADNEYADVRMEVKLPDRPPIQVNYSMYNTKDGWKVYDIAIEGVSLATTYRSQFSSEIRRSGLDELIANLAARNLKRAETTATTAGKSPAP